MNLLSDREMVVHLNLTVVLDELLNMLLDELILEDLKYLRPLLLILVHRGLPDLVTVLMNCGFYWSLFANSNRWEALRTDILTLNSSVCSHDGQKTLFLASKSVLHHCLVSDGLGFRLFGKFFL